MFQRFPVPDSRFFFKNQIHVSWATINKNAACVLLLKTTTNTFKRISLPEEGAGGSGGSTGTDPASQPHQGKVALSPASAAPPGRALHRSPALRARPGQADAGCEREDEGFRQAPSATPRGPHLPGSQRQRGAPGGKMRACDQSVS